MTDKSKVIAEFLSELEKAERLEKNSKVGKFPKGTSIEECKPTKHDYMIDRGPYYNTPIKYY